MRKSVWPRLIFSMICILNLLELKLAQALVISQRAATVAPTVSALTTSTIDESSTHVSACKFDPRFASARLAEQHAQQVARVSSAISPQAARDLARAQLRTEMAQISWLLEQVKTCEDLPSAQARTRARGVSAGTVVEVARERSRVQWADHTLRNFASLADLRVAAARELERLSRAGAPLGLTRSEHQLAFEPLLDTRSGKLDVSVSEKITGAPTRLRVRRPGRLSPLEEVSTAAVTAVVDFGASLPGSVPVTTAPAPLVSASPPPPLRRNSSGLLSPTASERSTAFGIGLTSPH